MGDRTGIQWTDATWNPLRGCTRISEGCVNCYAERVAARFAMPGLPYYGIAKMTAHGPRWTGEIMLVESALLQPLRWTRPRHVFVNSMSDLFHERVPDEWIDRVFAVMALATQHRFQVLTKRPQRMLEWVRGQSYRAPWLPDTVCEAMGEFGEDPRRANRSDRPGWPLPNVWLGVSVEDQATADERIPLLLRTPAALRFISAEPLLGPIDLTSAWDGYNALDSECWGDCAWCEKGLPPLHNCQRGRQSEADWLKGRSGLDWVISGGESGPGARPCVMGWIKDIVRHCREAEVPVFVKQLGSVPTNREGERCPNIKHHKGADMAEWPAELQVREMPGR